MFSHGMKANIARHQSILCTDRDRFTKFFFFFSHGQQEQKSSSLTLLVARVTHRASRNLTSHLPLSLPRAPQPEWWPLRPMGELSAGPVSRICSEHPPPVSVSREQTVCLARLEFLPIFPLSQTERGGSRGGGGSSGMLPTGEGGQQRKQEKYIFLSLRSPSKALYSSSSYVCGSPVFHLLYRARLSLCPSLTQTPNPPRFTPHSFLNPKSLLSSLLDLFQLFCPYLSVTHLLPRLLSVYHIWTCHLSV